MKRTNGIYSYRAIWKHCTDNRELRDPISHKIPIYDLLTG